MEPIFWTCPYCGRDATIKEDNISIDTHFCSISSTQGEVCLSSEFIICPNPECKQIDLKATLMLWDYNGSGRKYYTKVLRKWNLLPLSRAKHFPEYVPVQIIQDYEEAHLICELSPKASATLARRCLQGMIRNFWGIVKGRLIEEIEELEGKVDPTTWEAIDSVRKIGNIGAHFEKDIDTIVEVEPEEAKQLLELIEMLISNWYIDRHDRQLRLQKIKSIADSKDTKTKSTNP